MEAAGWAEIDNLGVSSRIDQYVQFFKIPMRNLIGPHKMNSFEYLPGCLQKIQLPPSSVRLGEATLIVLHENIPIFFLFFIFFIDGKIILCYP